MNAPDFCTRPKALRPRTVERIRRGIAQIVSVNAANAAVIGGPCGAEAESHCDDGPGCMTVGCWKIHHPFQGGAR